MKRKSIDKRVVSLFFIFLLLFTNLSLFSINEAQAATLLPPTTGSCQQNSGTGSANNYIYPIGTIQITSTNSELNPGQDDSANTTATTGNARATRNGSISNNGDVIGRVFSIIPPTGTKFVILSGKEDSSNPSNLAQANATISNSFSQDGMGVDSSLGISVGVVTAGTAGVDRVIVSIARDADTTGNVETYPKSGTGSNTAFIAITGLGLSIPPSGSFTLSGTLSASIDSTPPTGIGISGDVSNSVVTSAIPGFTGTFNICTTAGSSPPSPTPSPTPNPTPSTSSPVIIQTTANSNDTCATASGTSIYPVGAIQLTALVNYFSPGPDDSPTTSSTIGNARAVNGGRISSDGDVIGNVFSLAPPSGAKFVILPGFENPSSPTLIASSNTTITNASSTDSTSINYNYAESTLGISVGVITTGSAGNGRAIVAIARDADGATANNSESYPKSGTGNNTATIMINGLGIQFDPGVPISGILQITPDNLVISGIGRSGGSPASFVSSVLPLLPTTPLSICNFGSALTTTSSSSGSIASSSSSGSLTSSSGGFTTSSSGGRPTSSSGGSFTTSSSGGKVSNSSDCPPCLVSSSRCPINCPEKLINCDGVAYLNICDYQRIKCGCITPTTTSSTSSSGGIVSTTSSTSSGGTIEVPKLNSAFEGIWKGIVKQTSTGLGRRLITLGLCINDDDGELEGTVAVKKFIDAGEIISQEVKSENEVSVDVVDSKDNIFTLVLKLIGTRKMQIKIGDKTDGTARQTTKNKRCFIPSSSRAQKQKIKSK